MRGHVLGGYIAATLATLFGITSVFEIIFKFDIPLEATVAYWSIVFAIFIYSVTEYFSSSDSTLDRLDRTTANGVELFNHSDDFIDRLIDVTKRAEVVCTINFSPPRGKSKKLDKYFEEVSKATSSRNSKMKAFMSIANIESAEKAQWIVDRAMEAKDGSKVSLGVLKSTSAARLMCFHIVLTGTEGYTFFYPPVPLTGVMDAAMVRHRELAEQLKKQFDLMWADCIHISDGSVVYSDGISEIKGRFNELQNNAMLVEAGNTVT